MLTDTHTHICDTAFDADRAEVLARAEQSGIRAIIAVGEDQADGKKNLVLAREFPILKPAAGLYPTHLDLAAAEKMAARISQLKEAGDSIGGVVTCVARNVPVGLGEPARNRFIRSSRRR